MSASTFHIGSDKQNQGDKIDLKLSGDKVKLEVRPLSNLGKASSKCVLLGQNSSRPVSALPLLDLYQLQHDDFEFSTNNRRPFSADCINFNKFDHDQFLRRESSDFDEKNLPSSNLLQNLLSEPIKSWRAGESFNSDKKSCDASIISEVPMKNLQSNTDFDNRETSAKDIENVLSKSDLKPGLVTKPPLPKKPDLNQINQSIIKVNQHRFDQLNHNSEKNHTQKNVNDSFNNEIQQTKKIVGFHFENLSVEVENDKQYQQKHKSVPYEISCIPENVDRSMKRCPQNDIVRDFECNKNQPINKDLMVQNWILGENSVKYEIVEKNYQNISKKDSLENEVHFKEQQTDERIKQISQKCEKCENFEEQKTNPDINIDERFDKFFKGPNVSSNSHFEQPTKSKIKKDLTRRTPPKTKLEVVTKPKSDETVRNDEKTFIKTGFSPKPIKSQMDFQSPTHFNDDSTSWMAHNYLSKQNEPNSDSKTTTKSSPNNYLNFLESLEELQDLSRIIENEPPEQDSDKGYETSTDNGTYDEIVSILEVLEAEDKRSQKKMESIKEIVNTELCETKNTEDATTCEFDQNGDFGKNQQSDNNNVHTSANFGHLLQFLDEVDRNCNKTIEHAQERVQKVTEVLETTFNLDTIPKMADLMSLTNSELAQQVIDLSLRVKDKSSSVALLQRELSALREQIMKINKKNDNMMKEKLKTQKQEYESTIKRHQQFIDQLMADKKSLNQQCEGLVRDMKILEDRFASNMKAIEHRHQVELQKAKEMCVAGEKIRRDRWLDNKTQKIKEMTVKSIAPELEKMEKRQQQELADMRALHKNEIEDLEMKAARKTQQQLENLRHQMIEEREKTLAHEREIMRMRYEKLVESEEKAYQEQRRRLLSEISKRQKEYEERATILEEEKIKAIEQFKQEYEEKLETLVRRHNNELKLMKETSEIEMEAHRNNYKKQMSIELAQKEATIKEYYRKERDREIETIIERLEAESNENKLQIENSAENRIKRIKEKFEVELKELELSEKETKKKCAQLKTKLTETEETMISLKASVRKLQTQLDESRKVSKTLTDERSKMKEILKREMSEEVENLRRDVAKIKSEHERELQQVYARVKVSVSRKDEIISELTGELNETKEKCAYLENMLEQQRKEYLMK